MKSIRVVLLVFQLSAALTSAAQVTTSQYDNFRTGATLSEKVLMPLMRATSARRSTPLSRMASAAAPQMATRFVIPLVVNGRVYFGTRSEVEVYGLLK